MKIAYFSAFNVGRPRNEHAKFMFYHDMVKILTHRLKKSVQNFPTNRLS